MTALEALAYCANNMTTEIEDGSIRSSVVLDSGGGRHWIEVEVDGVYTTPQLSGSAQFPFSREWEPYRHEHEPEDSTSARLRKFVRMDRGLTRLMNIAAYELEESLVENAELKSLLREAMEMSSSTSSFDYDRLAVLKRRIREVLG